MDIYQEKLDEQRKYFLTGETRNIRHRKNNLKRLYEAIKENEDMILQALAEDLGKSRTEGYATEVGIVLNELRNAIRNVSKWTRKKSVPTALLHFPSRSYVIKEPIGSVLIMSPWNYPFQLTMVPFIGALAAGCTVIVKPSRYSQATSKAMKYIINDYFPEKECFLFEGGREVNTALLDLKWDYIFFTGSPSVGKIVLSKAAENLTPVTLELGGKSPVIITEHSDEVLAAKRLIYGKFLNLGQTCVAPDYILIHKSKTKRFLSEVEKGIKKAFGEDPISSPDYGKIINRHHYERLLGLIKGSPVYYGGKSDDEKLKIAPTILFPVCVDEPVMQEEIFGPVMPVIEYEDLDEAIKFINDRPHPLALYIFSDRKSEIEKVHGLTLFGGGCINDAIMHIVSHNLPFGGVGNSGMGSYHGKRSFDTFTHEKGILKHYKWPDITLRNPPYKGKDKIIRLMLH